MPKQISESRLGYRTIKNEGAPYFDLHTIEQLGSNGTYFQRSHELSQVKDIKPDFEFLMKIILSRNPMG